MSFYGTRWINEAGKKSDLTDKQISNIAEEATKKYEKEANDIIKKTISKYKELAKAQYGNSLNQFRYVEWFETFCSEYDGFDNYAFASNDDLSDTEAKKLIDKYCSDLSSLVKELNSKLPKNLLAYVEDEEGYSISEFKSNMKKWCKDGHVPSNCLLLFVRLKNYKEFLISEDAIKEKDKQKYLDLYKEYLKFLSNPHKLSGNFWSGTIADISRIMGVSSDKLNEIVSKNIKSIGTKATIDNNFDDSDYGASIVKKLGECYTIESFDSDRLIYSIPNKKLYWINFEHSECEAFYHNYPMSSKEFEEVANGFDNNLKQEIKDLFKKYNEENNIKII